VEWPLRSKLKYEHQVSGYWQPDIFVGRFMALLGGL